MLIKISAKLSVFSFFLAILSCQPCSVCPGDEDPAVIKPDETDYDTNYSIQVNNGTNKRLVAFKGEVDINNLIGLISTSSLSSHGLPRDDKLFSQAGEFVLKIITEESYYANYDDLTKAPVYGSIYAFYNADATKSGDTEPFKISSRLGGNSKLDINNTTSFNIELRDGGPTGDSLAYIPPDTHNFQLSLSEGDYDLIALFRKYSPYLKEVIEVYPKAVNGEIVVNSISLNRDDTRALTYDNSYIEAVDFTPKSAYITFHNNATNSGVYVRVGTEVLFTSTGRKIVNPNDSLSFHIDMTRTGEIVGTSRTLGNILVIQGSFQEQLQSFEFLAGSIYEVIITGDSINGIALSGPTKIGEIDVDSLEIQKKQVIANIYTPDVAQGLNNFVQHGYPPSALRNAQGRKNVTDPNGDSCYHSGIVFNGKSFAFESGLEISFDYYYNTTTNLWSEIAIKLIDTPISYGGVGADGCIDPRDEYPLGDHLLTITGTNTTGQQAFRYYANTEDHREKSTIETGSFSSWDSGIRGIVFTTTTGIWHSVTMKIVDNNTIQLYVDGEFILTASKDTPFNYYGNQVYLSIGGRSTFTDSNILFDNPSIGNE